MAAPPSRQRHGQPLSKLTALSGHAAPLVHRTAMLRRQPRRPCGLPRKTGQDRRPRALPPRRKLSRARTSIAGRSIVSLNRRRSIRRKRLTRLRHRMLPHRVDHSLGSRRADPIKRVARGRMADRNPNSAVLINMTIRPEAVAVVVTGAVAVATAVVIAIIASASAGAMA
jgi:hypothetical protein